MNSVLIVTMWPQRNQPANRLKQESRAMWQAVSHCPWEERVCQKRSIHSDGKGSGPSPCCLELDSQILTPGLREGSWCYGVAIGTQRSSLILPCFVSFSFTTQRFSPFLVLWSSGFSSILPSYHLGKTYSSLWHLYTCIWHTRVGSSAFSDFFSSIISPTNLLLLWYKTLWVK